jgi:hypothetical protein
MIVEEEKASLSPHARYRRSEVFAQDFSDMVAAKAAQQKRKAAERKDKAKKKESFKF